MLSAASASGSPDAALVADLYVFGGAAMALAYDSRRAACDVDALSASRVFDHPGLRVFAASPEHLLAMKAFAARPRDAEDIRQLVQVLDLHTVEDVLASVREIFPEEQPPERLRLLLEDIFPDKG